MTSPTTGPERPSMDLPPNSDPATGHNPASPQPSHGAHGAHRWMLICCLPMVAIVVLLIVSGTAGSGALLWALGCVAMMVAMMFMMPGGHNHK